MSDADLKNIKELQLIFFTEIVLLAKKIKLKSKTKICFQKNLKKQ